jgi:thiol-disulfide isomerase/thioredoxin
MCSASGDPVEGDREAFADSITWDCRLSSGLQIGPFALPYTLLLVLAAFGAATLVVKLLGREHAREVDSLLWQAAIAGFVAARLAFVWQFRDSYLAAPLGILDIRDGGWTPAAGFAVAALLALRQWRRPLLRRPLWSALATGVVIWGVGTLALDAGTADGPRLPPLALVSLEGATVKLSEFQGKPTVVNLWATWCPPCVREMPVLHQAQIDHPTVNFVFVNAGEPAQRVQGWLQGRQLPLRNVLLDPANQVAKQFKAPGFPTTLFFDASGVLVSVRVGELSTATLRARLGKL